MRMWAIRQLGWTPLGLRGGPYGLGNGRYGQYYATKRAANNNPPRPAVTACPSSPPSQTNENWKPYYGQPEVFHCGYRTFLETITPSRDRLMGKCVYDESDQLVDENHEYAGCRGTPNRWGEDNPILHSLIDPGGIARAGAPALAESIRHGSALEWLGKKLMRQPGDPVIEMPEMP